MTEENQDDTARERERRLENFSLIFPLMIVCQNLNLKFILGFSIVDYFQLLLLYY